MGYGDLILFPVFLIVLSLFFKIIRNTYDDPLLKKYHRQGFWVKIFGCILFFMYSVYLSPGDSTGLYQKEGNNIYHLILQDPSHLQWIFQKAKFFDEYYLKDPYNAGYLHADA